MKKDKKADKPKIQRDLCSLDDRYNELYLETPTETHTKLYLQACEDCDQPPAINARSAAHQLHKRLESNLNTLLIQQSDKDKALGRSVVRDLAMNAKSESVKGAMGQTLAKGLYPDVQVIKEELTLEELQEESRLLDEQLKEARGQTH